MCKGEEEEEGRDQHYLLSWLLLWFPLLVVIVSLVHTDGTPGPSPWLFPGGCAVNFLRFLLRDLPTAEDLTVVDSFQLTFNPARSPPMAPAFHGPFSGNPPSYVEGKKGGSRWLSLCPLDLQEVGTFAMTSEGTGCSTDTLFLPCTLSEAQFCYLGRNRTNQQGCGLIRWPPGNVVPVFPAFKGSQYL